MPGSSASSACEQHGAEVAGRVAEVVLHLQAEPDLAAVADHRGRGHRQQRAQLHRAVGALERQRRGRGRHQLAQRDDVALRRQALERPGHEDRRRAPGRAVAGLVALAGAARARLARADLPGRARWRGRRGSSCESSFP